MGRLVCVSEGADLGVELGIVSILGCRAVSQEGVFCKEGASGSRNHRFEVQTRRKPAVAEPQPQSCLHSPRWLTPRLPTVDHPHFSPPPHPCRSGCGRTS